MKVNKIEVSVDKLIMLYCNMNNSLHGKSRKSLWDFLFGKKDHDDEIETFFSTIKGQVVDIIDTGLKEQSGLVREITPFVVKPDDIKKYLKF